MVCPPAVHLNPAKYQDPLVFNPSRWEVRLAFFSSFSFHLFKASCFKESQKVMQLASLASTIDNHSSNLDSSLSCPFFYNFVIQKEMVYREWNRVVLPNISWLLVEA
jgi:hypothetical protein